MTEDFALLNDIENQIQELKSEHLNKMMAMAKKAPFKKGHDVKVNGGIFNGRLMKVERIEFVECESGMGEAEYAFIGHGRLRSVHGVSQRRGKHVVYCDVYGRMREKSID
tara:strand:- start:609 stop:938 length:330 start_codon:yes stop_codon:yes gene_type:complete